MPNDEAGTLARVDPRTNLVTRRLRFRPGLFSVAHGFGALWVVNSREGWVGFGRSATAVARDDPRTRRSERVP